MRPWKSSPEQYRAQSGPPQASRLVPARLPEFIRTGPRGSGAGRVRWHVAVRHQRGPDLREGNPSRVVGADEDAPVMAHRVRLGGAKAEGHRLALRHPGVRGEPGPLGRRDEVGVPRKVGILETDL